MLSIENPSDPSSSSRVSVIKNNERASQKLAFQVPDLASFHLDDHTHLPKFSIRDYVISARTNDIEKNWPFQQKYLQICLHHGIKDVLPPFEPPDFVRTGCCGKKVGADQPVASFDGENAITVVNSTDSERISSLDIETNDIKDESAPRTDGSALGSSNGFQFPVSDVREEGFGKKDGKYHRGPLKSLCLIENANGRDVEFASTVTSGDWIEGNTSTVQNLPSSLLEPKGTPETSLDQLEKESNLIENLDLITGPSRTEEIVLNLSLLSEPMASKVCPVCKSFTSPSNTTLNAHIDQCLKVDSSAKLATTNQTGHKVKPRKKVSMVDIYANAPRCTLEELDRRNGRNWVGNASCLPSNGDICKETKIQRVSPLSIMGEDDANAVYVDSNGTKIRILSKLNDVAPIMREKIKQKKHSKDFNKEKSLLDCNRRRFAPNNSKDLKLNLDNKKLSSLKPKKNEILEVLEEASCMDGEGSKEKTLSQLQKSQTGTLRKWVCSKRSILSKSKQLFINGVKDLVLPKQHPRIKFKSNQLKAVDSCREGNHILKISRSLENSDSFHSFKRLDSQLNTYQKTDDGRKVSLAPSTSDGCVLRLTRPSGNHVSSARSKRGEVHLSTDQNDDHAPITSVKLSGNHCHPAKTNRLSNLRKNTFLDGSDLPRKKKKCNENMERLIFWKPQKEPSGTETRECIGEMPPPEAIEVHDCISDSGDSLLSKSRSLNKINRTHKLNFPKNVTRPETAAQLVDGGNVGRSILLHEKYEPETRNLRQRRKEKSIVKLGSKSGRNKELKGNKKNTVLASANEMDTINMMVKSNKSSKFTADFDQSDIPYCSPLVCGCEAQVESALPVNFSCNQETLSEEISNVFSGQKDQKDAAISVRLGKSLSEIDNLEIGSTPNQGPEVNFSSQMDMEFEIAQDEPSIGNVTVSPQSTAASGQLLFAQDEHNRFDKDPSRSTWMVSSSGPSGLSSDTYSSFRRGESGESVSDCALSYGMIVAEEGREKLDFIDVDFKVGLIEPGKEPVEVSYNRMFPSCKGINHTDLAQAHAPPSPNPILRLMGKNLMVASKDVEDCNQLRGFSNGTSNNNLNTKYPTLLGFSTECSSNKDMSSFYPNGSLIFDSDSCNPLQNFVGASKSVWNHSNPGIYEPTTDLGYRSEMNMASFAASGPGSSGISIQTQEKKPNKKLNSSASLHWQNQIPSGALAANSFPEVIVIDDCPEPENDSSTVYTSYAGPRRINWSLQLGNASNILNYCLKKPSQAHSCFPSQSTNDPPAGLGLCSLMSRPGANKNSKKRGSSWEGSGVLPKPFILPSVSTCCPNPTLYFSQR